MKLVSKLSFSLSLCLQPFRVFLTASEVSKRMKDWHENNEKLKLFGSVKMKIRN